MPPPPSSSTRTVSAMCTISAVVAAGVALVTAAAERVNDEPAAAPEMSADGLSAGSGAVVTLPATDVQARGLLLPSPTRRAEPTPGHSARRAPRITDLLTSEDGALRTRVGRYDDCSGATPLSTREAAVDTCMRGPVYFLGHNPGVFTPLMSIGVGSTLTWYNHAGTVQRYRVIAVRDESSTTPRVPVTPQVTAEFQTCLVPDGSVDRILDAVPA